MTTRRNWLRAGLAAALAPLALRALAAQEPVPLGGRGEVGALADTFSVGRLRDRTVPLDNDDAIRTLELGLKCPCPCGLDIYTCRTTDFTCTYSPESHKEILGYVESGRTADEIVAIFEEKYGERALMAPKARGFNLAGYLVPSVAVLTAGGLLTWVLQRKARLARPAFATVAAARAESAAATGDATPDELERLRRALAEDA